MKTQLKFMAVLLGASLAILATVFSAFASTPGFQRAGTAAAAPVELGTAEKAAGCTKMAAGDVAWVTLTTGIVVPGTDGTMTPAALLAMTTATAPAADALFTLIANEQVPRRITAIPPAKVLAG